MRDPNEIKRALRQCAEYRTIGDCIGCPYTDTRSCSDLLMLDALSLIEQLDARIVELEAKPDKPAPAQSNLPKGWIEIHSDYGGVMVIDSSKVVSVEEGYPIDRRIVRFAGTYVVASESVEEILEKIREATS